MPDYDRELQEAVQGMLDQDKDLKGYGLKASVIQGEVQVSGVVDTLAEKTRLEEDLKGMPGVKGMELGLAVSTDGAMDDEAVTQEVLQELGAHPRLDLRQVGAKSVGGRVFLMGRVESPEGKQEAIKAAQKARGVTEVVSQLQIGPGAVDDSPEAIFHRQVNNDHEDAEETRLL